MRRSFYCPSNVDNMAQYNQALRNIEEGDDVTFHFHGSEVTCIVRKIQDLAKQSDIDIVKVNSISPTSCWTSA